MSGLVHSLEVYLGAHGLKRGLGLGGGYAAIGDFSKQVHLNASLTFWHIEIEEATSISSVRSQLKEK